MYFQTRGILQIDAEPMHGKRCESRTEHKLYYVNPEQNINFIITQAFQRHMRIWQNTIKRNGMINYKVQYR